MVGGPTLVGTANSLRPPFSSKSLPFLTTLTELVCRSPRPSEPGPSSAVMGGMPARLPTKPVNTPGRRVSLLKRNRKVMSSTHRYRCLHAFRTECRDRKENSLVHSTVPGMGQRSESWSLDQDD